MFFSFVTFYVQKLSEHFCYKTFNVTRNDISVLHLLLRCFVFHIRHGWATGQCIIILITDKIVTHETQPDSHTVCSSHVINVYIIFFIFPHFNVFNVIFSPSFSHGINRSFSLVIRLNETYPG